MEHETTYTSPWTGQDGNQWREVSYWVGNGYRTFLQKLVNGEWQGW
jgi:hypothetical protein